MLYNIETSTQKLYNKITSLIIYGAAPMFGAAVVVLLFHIVILSN